MIVDVITSLFAGAMIVLLPFFLLRTIKEDSESWRTIAWAVLAVFAWVLAVYLSFIVPWAGPIGIIGGALFWWRASRKPKIISQTIEEEPRDQP